MTRRDAHAWCADTAPLCAGRTWRLCRAPLVTMMKTANFGYRDDLSGGRSTGRSVIWRVLLETEVRPTPMVVLNVGRQDAPEMLLVEDDHVIEALSSDRADQSLDVWILPRTRGRANDFGDAHASQSALEDVAVDAVSIAV